MNPTFKVDTELSRILVLPSVANSHAEGQGNRAKLLYRVVYRFDQVPIEESFAVVIDELHHIPLKISLWLIDGSVFQLRILQVRAPDTIFHLPVETIWVFPGFCFREESVLRVNQILEVFSYFLAVSDNGENWRAAMERRSRRADPIIMSCEPRSTHVDSDNSTERRAFSFDHWLVAEPW